MEVVDNALKSRSDYLVFVAEKEGSNRVVGYACYGPTLLGEGVYDLYWLAVAPDSQGCGIGGALLRAVEGAVRAAGGRMLLIETASKPSYARTRAFYEHEGYSETARVPDFYREGDDKIIYAKRFRPAKLKEGLEDLRQGA